MAKYTKYVKESYSSYEDFKVNFNLEAPENFNFAYDVLDEIADEEPGKTALVWCDIEGNEKVFTFAEMKKYTDKAANYLQGCGVKRGMPVMLILKRHYQFWYTIMALHKLGAVVIPATNLLTTKDIVYRIDAADVEMIICTSQNGVPERVLEGVKKSGRDVKLACTHGKRDGFEDYDAEVEAAGSDFVRPTGGLATENGDPMLLYFTSGTTGYPKMVRQDYLYPLGHIATAKFWHNAADDGLHLTVAETGWAKAVWGKLYGQWLAGTAIFAYDFDKFVPADLLKMIEKYKITTFCAPPTMYRYMIREDLSKFDLSNLKYATVAGEALNPEVFNAFREATGLSIREGYGQTELTLCIATYPWMEPKPGSMGKPAPGYDMDIVDDTGRHCRPGEVGEIIIKANKVSQIGVFMGYYKDDELTNSVWNDGIYHTGDMAWRDEDGYYWYVGRTDDVIKSSGYRIGPFEVESALMEHDAVVECAVTGAPDEIRGTVIKATVVLAEGYTPGDALVKELQQHVKKVTAPYKYPRIIEFVPELPKTISGKIRRVEIREKGNMS